MLTYFLPKLRVRNVVFLLFLLAGIGLFIPGSPAYLPSLQVHYSHFHDGHSLGYWVRALDRPDTEVRRRGILAVGAIGEDAAESVPTLARILTEDPDHTIRHQAALALLKMNLAAAPAVPALARALDEDDAPKVRMNAAIALSRLGTQARPAVPVLVKALRRKANRTNLGTFTFTIQEMAATALGRASAGTSEGLAPLLEALKGAHTASKRRLVAHALGEIGAPARVAEPQLRALLTDNSIEVREAAKEALRKILEE